MQDKKNLPLRGQLKGVVMEINRIECDRCGAYENREIKDAILIKPRVIKIDEQTYKYDLCLTCLDLITRYAKEFCDVDIKLT